MSDAITIRATDLDHAHVKPQETTVSREAMATLSERLINAVRFSGLADHSLTIADLLLAGRVIDYFLKEVKPLDAIELPSVEL